MSKPEIQTSRRRVIWTFSSSQQTLAQTDSVSILKCVGTSSHCKSTLNESWRETKDNLCAVERHKHQTWPQTLNTPVTIKTVQANGHHFYWFKIGVGFGFTISSEIYRLPEDKIRVHRPKLLPQCVQFILTFSDRTKYVPWAFLDYSSAINSAVILFWSSLFSWKAQ